MRFIPLTAADQAIMLAKVGAGSLEELFDAIPENIRLDRTLDLPDPMPEMDLAEYFEQIALRNSGVNPRRCFTGAGAYPHHVPVAVDQLLLRSELFTCYTPYQPEVSQGTLMAIYEYQTYTSALLGMDVANASMYDGASALAEAVIMANRVTKRPRVILSNLIHPYWRDVVATYVQHLNIDLVLANSLESGVFEQENVKQLLGDDCAAIVVQSPNFMGNIEDLAKVRELCDASGAMMIVGVAEPVALGTLKGPGEFGADICVAEGRSFGGSLSFGGPGLGMFAVKQKLARQMPGRVVGKTKDRQDREGYVLTLATREQHIRRERATSNICSNQALCATAAAIHLSLLGASGVKKLADRNYSTAGYLAEKITSIKGFERLYDKRFFNEVAIRTPVAPSVINQRLGESGICGGVDLSQFYPPFGSAMVFCGTEVHTKKTIDELALVLSEFEK